MDIRILGGYHPYSFDGRKLSDAYSLVCCTFLLDGYWFFLYDSNPTKIGAKNTKALKNYLKIWAISFALLTSIVFILKVIYSNPLGWSLKDITDLFLVLGNCLVAELVTIHGISYGTSAWSSPCRRDGEVEKLLL